MSDSRDILQKMGDVRDRLGRGGSGLGDPEMSVQIELRHGPHHSEVEQNHRQIGSNIGYQRSPKPLSDAARNCIGRCRQFVREIQSLSETNVDHSLAPISTFVMERSNCVAMVEAATSLLQHLPEETAAQLRLCEGLDALLDALGDRITQLR